MPDFLVATPLKHSVVTKSYKFGDGISIEKLSPILWDISIAKGYISEHDRDYMSEDRYWVCASAEAQSQDDKAAQELWPDTLHTPSKSSAPEVRRTCTFNSDAPPKGTTTSDLATRMKRALPFLAR
jgi:hypothetical protein